MNTTVAWSIRGLMVAAVMAGAAACTSQEFTVEQPDGTKQVYRQVQLNPHFVVRPDQVEVRSAGTTDEGFPVEVIIRRDGKGDTVYRVTPPVGDPLFFRQVKTPKPGTGVAAPEATDEPAATRPECGPGGAYRVRADLSLDAAQLDGRSPDGTWVPVVHGDLAVVARVAAARGLLPLELDNDAGHWRITADRRFPMVTVRRNGALVQVRGLP